MNARDYASVGRKPNGNLMLGTWLLHRLAKLVNLQIHIGGWPYGAAWRTSVNGRAFPNEGETARSA